PPRRTCSRSCNTPDTVPAGPPVLASTHLGRPSGSSDVRERDRTAQRTMAVILAGGEGERLSILSQERAKPAVPFGGKYRIIDFTLSNCVNSDIDDVVVLTQYNPRSLNDHIGLGRPWDLDRNRGGVKLLQPYISRGKVAEWYRGTADAVLRNINVIEHSQADTIVVLAGDH